jgi:catalase
MNETTPTTNTLTTEAGAPVADNQHSQLAGPGGPTLLQDHHLLEKLARFNLLHPRRDQVPRLHPLAEVRPVHQPPARSTA